MDRKKNDGTVILHSRIVHLCLLIIFMKDWINSWKTRAFDGTVVILSLHIKQGTFEA
jgi:hypothetical protein